MLYDEPRAYRCLTCQKTLMAKGESVSERTLKKYIKDEHRDQQQCGSPQKPARFKALEITSDDQYTPYGEDFLPDHRYPDLVHLQM